MTTHKASIGTISEATHRPEDLIPSFMDELERLDAVKAQSILDEFGIGSGADWGTEEFYDSEDAQEMIESLFDALNDHAPAYCYFGALEGDGADFGFWPSMDSLNEDSDSRFGSSEVVKVSDLAEVSSSNRFPRFVMQVNDHGNVTLYRVRIELDEEWSIV